MSVKVTQHGTAKGKWAPTTIEVDGVDISNHVTAYQIVRSSDGGTRLMLSLVLFGEDAVDIEIPREDVSVRAKIMRDGELIDVSATGDAATRYLEAAAKA